MLKLAFISTLQLRDPWGGSEELWSQAAMRLVREGYPITVCVHRFPVVPPPVRALEEAGCHIHFRRPGTLTFKVLKRVIPGLASRWLDRVRPDLVVVAQGANLDGVDWMLACIDRNIPYVIISQAALDLEFPDESLANAALRGYTQARRSYFVSEGNVRTTQRQIGGPVPGALVVRNPFKVNYDARPAWPDETVWRLACVGRLSPDSKGQDLLLDLLSTETWRQRPVRLTLYGQGAYRYGFERIIQERGLANVSIGGYVSDMEAVWADNHALVLFSRFEGLPLAIVEAMLCGRPCIVTNIAGNAELIQDNVTGFVARAPYIDAVEEAMERAWSRRTEWREIGQAARVAVREQIPRDPIAVFVEQIKSCIESICPVGADRRRDGIKS